MFRPRSLCCPPRSSLPLRVLPQGSRGFYVRAERASLPPHAPDMLTVRTQAIDGTRTFTLLDSRPCRPLPTGVTPYLRYFGPLRLPAGPQPRLCIPAARWSLPLPPDRASQAPRLIFPRALSPTTPEGPMTAYACCFTIGLVWLHPSREDWPPSYSYRGRIGSLALRLACSPRKSASPITGTHACSATC